MIKRMLVPLDGSKSSEAILPYVSYLAKGFRIPLVVMMAVEPDARDQMGGPTKAKTYLEEITKRLAREGLQAELHVASGRPAEEILRAAESRGCNLIALSARSEKAAGHGILGSVTTKILYSSPIPTLIIAPRKAATGSDPGVHPPRLIVPLDGSPFGETALPYAQELAQQLSLEILLARAIGDRTFVSMADPSAGMFVVDLQEAATAETNEYLKRVKEEVKREGLRVDSKLLQGTPARSIVELAASIPHSMIVMSTHGQSALARWVIGSVTEAVVRTCEGPVLVIPRQYGRRYAIEVTDLLGRTPLFSKLTEGELESIAQMARVKAYQPGDVIVQEGDRSGGFFIIASGQVEVVKETGKPSVLATLRPGEFFGEMAVISDQPRSATVRALEATECVTLRRSDFLAELERYPQIAVHMLPELVRRLREAQGNVTPQRSSASTEDF